MPSSPALAASSGRCSAVSVGPRGLPSPTGLRTIHDRLVDDVNAFVAERGLQIVRFDKGTSKEPTVRPFLAAAEKSATPGVVMVGKAQERMPGGWRGFRRGGRRRHPHFVYRRQALYVDYWYFYLWDDDWGPGFIKLCPYAPTRCGAGATGTSGSSASSPRPAWTSPPWTTACGGLLRACASRAWKAWPLSCR